ncbi:MAG: ABC transporter substrate-binding protein, partial [Betaproteobacteria bacterium]|nr:ABC transporter substrate-binding protein [Betaproteobacteria bacterium]
MRHRLLATLIAPLLLPAMLLADTVTVVTSFPKEITTAYKKAFEARFPGDKL